MKYIEVYKAKQEMRGKEEDASNYNLGLYLRIAFNEPNKYPSSPFLYEPPRLTDEELAARLASWAGRK